MDRVEKALSRFPDLRSGWTIIGVPDRVMDVHLLLLTEAAFSAIEQADIARHIAAQFTSWR